MLYIDFIADRLTESQRAQLILPHHALHAQRLEFTLQEKPYLFEANPEPWFSNFLQVGPDVPAGRERTQN
jgi:hypothetical protein